MKINNKKSIDRKSAILIICFLSCIIVIAFLWIMAAFFFIPFFLISIIIILFFFSKLRYLEFELNEDVMTIKSSDPLMQSFFKSSRMKYYKQVVTTYDLKGKKLVIQVSSPKKIGSRRAGFNLDYMETDEWQNFNSELIKFSIKKKVKKRIWN
ncbi:hypothetical protein [Chryseobacterium sp. M5A1_1a]